MQLGRPLSHNWTRVMCADVKVHRRGLARARASSSSLSWRYLVIVAATGIHLISDGNQTVVGPNPVPAA